MKRVNLLIFGVSSLLLLSACSNNEIVKPDKVDDLMSHKIARDIKTKIEEELTYPGHIKVTVIREVRASEVAK